MGNRHRCLYHSHRADYFLCLMWIMDPGSKQLISSCVNKIRNGSKKVRPMTQPEQGDISQSVVNPPQRKLWDSRFLLTALILALLALVSAYLEYVVYPSILVSSQFGETNVSLHLSFLSFQYLATRGSEPVPGILSLDFFQIFFISLIGFFLWHYYEVRHFRSKNTI